MTRTTGRSSTFYRPMNDKEKALAISVFGHTLPDAAAIGIGNGLGFGGKPWTDQLSAPDPLMPALSYEMNIGNAAGADQTSKLPASCFVAGLDGTVSDLFIHEMTHVWQYHNQTEKSRRHRVWDSSATSTYEFTPGDPWDSYDAEQQASIVEKWYHDTNDSAAEQRAHPLYAYVRLVVRSAVNRDALRFAGGLTLDELNRGLADLRARRLD